MALVVADAWFSGSIDGDDRALEFYVKSVRDQPAKG